MQPWLAVLMMVRTVVAAPAGLDGDDFSRSMLATRLCNSNNSKEFTETHTWAF